MFKVRKRVYDFILDNVTLSARHASFQKKSLTMNHISFEFKSDLAIRLSHLILAQIMLFSVFMLPKKSLFIIPALVLSSWLANSAHATPIAHSLYNKHSATFHVSSGFLGIFGPKAKSIRYDARMRRAAAIAEKRAHRMGGGWCWRYVKQALLAAHVISSYPTSAYAKEAARELCKKFGFEKLPITNPYKAPVGAVLVYGGRDAGHVEIRTKDGFASDFYSSVPYPRPLIGIYVKPAA